MMKFRIEMMAVTIRVWGDSSSAKAEYRGASDEWESNQMETKHDNAPKQIQDNVPCLRLGDYGRAPKLSGRKRKEKKRKREREGEDKEEISNSLFLI
jgi:hypothetical protein